MVTIKMIARKCGLSAATVSRALNRQPGVSEHQAASIRQVAEQMGYVPNAAARTLKTNRSNIIGVLYRNLMAHEFFSYVLEGIHAEAERCGYELAFLNRNPSGNYLEHARQRQCAGVVVVQGQLYDYDKVMSLVKSDIPTVSVEYEFPGGTMVVNDNVESMEKIVHYLHDDMGHSRIAFIHGESCQVTSERLAGFVRGCRDCGIALPEEYIRPAYFRTPQEAARQTACLLDLPKPPTCIIFPDDLCYLGGAAAIRERGLDIPGDVSCFGYDGVSLVQAVTPRLTTYYQDAEQMGIRAMQEVITAIEDARCAVQRTVVIPGRIQPGDTVKKLQKEAAV